MKKGTFIVIDGLDGSGKTTEIKRLKKELPHTLFTSEPGGTPKAEKIRRTLLTHQAGKRDAVTDFFLFWAARAAHMEEAIAPALDAGTLVISDRFDSSTYAYQVRAEQRPDLEELFWAARRAVVGAYAPDAYIMLDLPPAAAMQRRHADTAKALTSFDTQKAAYHARVRAGFKAFKPAGTKVYCVDSSRSPEATHEAVRRIIEKILG